MGARLADPAQMAALAHRYEGAPAASVIFMLGALALLAGAILLAVALVRTQAAPVWAAICLPVGLVANIAAFTSSSRALLVVSSLILLAGMGRVAWGGRTFGAPAPVGA
jgi:hypothetical protein